MEAMEDNWDFWAKMIYSRVDAAKSPLTPEEINLRIKLLKGIDLPYKQFEFNTVEDMLLKVPGLLVFEKEGYVYAQTLPKETSKISNLQKSLDEIFEKYILVTSHDQNLDANGNLTSNENSIDLVDNDQLKMDSACVIDESKTEKISNSTEALDLQNQSKCISLQKNEIIEEEKSVSIKPIKPNNKRKFSTYNDSYANHNQNSEQSNPNVIRPQQQASLTLQSNVSHNINNQQYLECTETQNWDANDPRLHLQCYTTSKNLPMPEYKHLRCGTSNYVAVVNVASNKYSSFPHECSSKDDAEKFAATMALHDLLGKIRNSHFVNAQNALKLRDYLNFHSKQVNYANQLFFHYYQLWLWTYNTTMLNINYYNSINQFNFKNNS